MRPLRYRVVEAKVLRSETGFRVDAYLLIQGKGRPVHFEIASMEELPEALDIAVLKAYRAVTGSDLPDIAPSGSPAVVDANLDRP
jgi:hypothetical protein